MNSYKDLTIFFNTDLLDIEFQSFLKELFDDLSDYNILESDYITSKKNGIELGFKNDRAVYDEDDGVLFEKGRPVFSHFNLFPNSARLIDRLPFDIKFNENRTNVISKAGQPNQTNQGEIVILNKKYLVDNYFAGDLTITFDYEPANETINFIQIKNNKKAST
jgi:hypothetical protein